MPVCGIGWQVFCWERGVEFVEYGFFVNNEYWQYGGFMFLKIFVSYILEFVVSLYARAVAF